MRGRRAAVGAVLAAVLALGVVVAIALPSGPQDRPAAAGERSSSSPSPTATLPVIIQSCFIPSDTGNVSLSDEEAMALTTLAAGVRDPRRGQGRVRAAVARAVPDVVPASVADAADSLLGLRPENRLTCGHARLDVEPERAGPSGLTPRAQKLRRAWTRVFGPIIAGGFARGGVSSGHVDSSSHYDGRAIDVFFRPLGDREQRRRGHVFAQWLVAHGERYHILSVIYADKIWTSWASSLGWRDYVHPSGDTRNPVLRHLDHVHVAVESGRPYRG